MASESELDRDQSVLVIPGMIVVGILTMALILALAQVRPVQSSNSSMSSVLDPMSVKAGKTIFMTICAACHGPKATGLKGLGKPLIGSTFFNGHTDAELLAFLQIGRPITDPLNTTGVTMPPRGGRPTLTDADLKHVIAYIRSLNMH